MFFIGFLESLMFKFLCKKKAYDHLNLNFFSDLVSTPQYFIYLHAPVILEPEIILIFKELRAKIFNFWLQTTIIIFLLFKEIFN